MATTASETQSLLGHCKERGCDFALFATVDQVQEAESWRDVRKIGIPYRVGNYGYFGRCANGHKVFPLKRVKGTYSAAHQCDARCLNAKGNDCTCSCGGINHGRGHAITITAAVESPEGIHVGEIGKHIKGEVIVAGIRRNVGQHSSTLYTFLSTKQGAEIKWFAPKDLDVSFKQGEKLMIRAKVTRHENHDYYGKSTIVTYVEKVENEQQALPVEAA